jgi:16S rRNA (cytidine1402-2'-O)-methyltransferase
VIGVNGEPHATGVLQIVATPIGHLEDVTLRALRSLREADLVLAEDTRRTRTLLTHYGISKPLLSLHEHNQLARRERVLGELGAGRRVVLVSDAGTPLVSDPGERLLEAVLREGQRVEPIPGPSAVLAALVASGLSTATFAFVGFLPKRAGDRRRRLAELRDRTDTLIAFESPARLPATLVALREIFGADRRAVVARELTKLHEEIARGSLAELCERFREPPRGEITLVIEGCSTPPAEHSPTLVDDAIAEGLARGESARDLARGLAERTGISRSELYARIVAAREGAPR